MLVIKKTCYFIIFFIFCNSVSASDNLNKLFDELYYAKNLTQAEKIEDKIWKNWTKHPKSEYLTSKLENGTYSMYHQQYRMALKLFTDVINEDPKWAEGWNKRATVLYMMGNFELSQNDIDMVLSLEKRHFGALSGQGLVQTALENYEKAIDSYIEAHKIYPSSQSTLQMIEQLSILLQKESI